MSDLAAARDVVALLTAISGGDEQVVESVLDGADVREVAVWLGGALLREWRNDLSAAGVDKLLRIAGLRWAGRDAEERYGFDWPEPA